MEGVIQMTDAEILTNVKLNLAIMRSNWDGYLTTLIGAAKNEIAREGITLSSSIDDGNLVVMYAAYLFRKRDKDDAGMPRMLRYALNNRLLSEKGEVW